MDNKGGYPREIVTTGGGLRDMILQLKANQIENGFMRQGVDVSVYRVVYADNYVTFHATGMSGTYPNLDVVNKVRSQIGYFDYEVDEQAGIIRFGQTYGTRPLGGKP